jgi:signal peptidase
MRKTVRIIQDVVLGLFAVLGAASLVLVSIILLNHYKPMVVTSGSMEPTVSKGSLVMTREVPASELSVGDIVTVNRTDTEGLVTHRIVSITKSDTDATYVLWLRGDANRQNDQKPYLVTTADRYAWQIRHLGTVVSWLQDHAVAAIVLTLCLVAASFVGRTRVSVTMPDGRVIKDLTKREAQRMVELYREAYEQGRAPDTALPAQVSSDEPGADADTGLVGAAAQRSMSD